MVEVESPIPDGMVELSVEESKPVLPESISAVELPMEDDTKSPFVEGQAEVEDQPVFPVGSQELEEGPETPLSQDSLDPLIVKTVSPNGLNDDSLDSATPELKKEEEPRFAPVIESADRVASIETSLVRVNLEGSEQEDEPSQVDRAAVERIAEKNRQKTEVFNNLPKKELRTAPVLTALLAKEQTEKLQPKGGELAFSASKQSSPPPKKRAQEELFEFKLVPTKEKKVGSESLNEEAIFVEKKRAKGGSSSELSYFVYSGINALRRFSQSAIQSYLSTVSVDKKHRYRYYLTRGEQFFQSGQYQRATRYFEQALAERPDQIKIRAQLGLCYLQCNRLSEGVFSLEKAQSGGVRGAPYEEQLAFGYIRQGEDAKAVEMLEKSLLYSPTNFELNYRLAIALDNLGEYDRALQAFEKSLEIEPKNAKVYRSMGFSMEQAGKREKAVHYFKRAVELEEEFGP
jgi:tetratricopeptide (TPR) repeat protein